MVAWSRFKPGVTIWTNMLIILSIPTVRINSILMYQSIFVSQHPSILHGSLQALCIHSTKFHNMQRESWEHKTAAVSLIFTAAICQVPLSWRVISLGHHSDHRCDSNNTWLTVPPRLTYNNLHHLHPSFQTMSKCQTHNIYVYIAEGRFKCGTSHCRGPGIIPSDSWRILLARNQSSLFCTSACPHLTVPVLQVCLSQYENN